MKEFMEEDFLLTTDTARHLYRDYAKDLPIIDYHCHLSPREIFEDVRYENLTQLWLGGDHYKWRQMRANGVEERYITGDAPDREKFQKWAETLPLAVGNPLYHWSHLELRRYFGYEGYLNGDTAEEVWELSRERLSHSDMTARNLILRSHVEVLCTTDDPADSLEWHRRLREEGFGVRVLPAWRPDRAMQLEKPDYPAYLERLSESSRIPITDFASLMEALFQRMDYFEQQGCRVADHGLACVMYQPADRSRVEAIFAKRLRGEHITQSEELQFKTAFMVEMGRAIHSRNWVMQLHYGVQRDLNSRLFEALGPDAGIDAIGNVTSAVELGQYLNALERTGELPRTILYSLHPADNAVIGTVMGCFQDSSAVGKLQHGAAWWFNDNQAGIREQMISLANLGLLGNFVGMLTDSRSFLSYTRHEYFRRILCDLIGDWVEKGEYPRDEQMLRRIVQGICYGNAKRYFGF